MDLSLVTLALERDDVPSRMTGALNTVGIIAFAMFFIRIAAATDGSRPAGDLLERLYGDCRRVHGGHNSIVRLVDGLGPCLGCYDPRAR